MSGKGWDTTVSRIEGYKLRVLGLGKCAECIQLDLLVLL